MANLPTTETPPASPVTIEADTVEEALARVTSELGPDATIVSAERVRRGGIAGFFAREVIELIAEPGGALPILEAPAPEAPAIVAPPAPEAPTGGVETAFQRLLAAAEEDTPVVARPVVRETPPTPTGPYVRWDAGRLLDLGLPERLVQQVADLEPAADLAHLGSLAGAFQDICGEVPNGPHTMLGARMDRLATATDLVNGIGPLHVVLSDDPLPEMLPTVPAVVSWVTDEAAPRAIAMALGTGATLGWSMSSTFGSAARRVTPLDAAIAIRDLMERP